MSVNLESSRVLYEFQQLPKEQANKIISYLEEEEFNRQQQFSQELPTLRLENKVLLDLDQLPDVDWQTASKYMRCLKGRVMVEMAPPEYMRGDLHLPDNLANNLRPDVGVVLAAGPGTGLHPGDAVIVRAYDGTGRLGFSAGEYVAENEVVSYGIYVSPGDDGNIQFVPIDESILATLDGDLNMTPFGRNILVKRDAIVTRLGNLELSEYNQYRSNTGVIIEVGHKCEGAKVGMRIVYHPEACLDIQARHFADSDFALMSEDGVELVLTAGEVIEKMERRGLVA